MRKKIFMAVMVAATLAFATTACTKETPAEATTEAADVTEAVTTEEATSEEVSEESGDGSEEASSETETGKLDKVYTKEDLAKAFRLQNVKMMIETPEQKAVVINAGGDMMIASGDEATGFDLEMYLVDSIAYVRVVKDGKGVWTKSASEKDTVETLYNQMASANLADALSDVEYKETVSERGVIYDIVNANEMRDGKVYQELVFYVNVETGMIARTESDSTGKHVVIRYEQCDEIELPEEAKEAKEASETETTEAK